MVNKAICILKTAEKASSHSPSRTCPGICTHCHLPSHPPEAKEIHFSRQGIFGGRRVLWLFSSLPVEWGIIEKNVLCCKMEWAWEFWIGSACASSSVTRPRHGPVLLRCPRSWLSLTEGICAWSRGSGFVCLLGLNLLPLRALPFTISPWHWSPQEINLPLPFPVKQFRPLPLTRSGPPFTYSSHVL